MLWMRVAMGLALREDDREARAIEFYDLHLLLPLLPLDADPLQRRHALPAALLLLPDDRRRRPGRDLQDDPRQRPALQVEPAASATTGRRCAPWAATSRAPTARARASSRSSRSPTTPRSPSTRAASARAPSAPTSRPGTSTSRSSSTCARTPATTAAAPTTCTPRIWVPDLFMQRVEADGEWTLFSPSDVPDLHDLYGTRLRRALRRVRSRGRRAARSRIAKRCAPSTSGGAC